MNRFHDLIKFLKKGQYSHSTLLNLLKNFSEEDGWIVTQDIVNLHQSHIKAEHDDILISLYINNSGCIKTYLNIITNKFIISYVDNSNRFYMKIACYKVNEDCAESAKNNYEINSYIKESMLTNGIYSVVSIDDILVSR